MSEIPTCPYDGEPCKVKEQHHLFSKHEDYLGVLPVCRVCALHKIRREVMVLRHQ